MQVEISALTDRVGSASYNQSLSERCALNRGRLIPQAFGESSPIDGNVIAERRARNRRVELYAR